MHSLYQRHVATNQVAERILHFSEETPHARDPQYHVTDLYQYYVPFLFTDALLVAEDAVKYVYWLMVPNTTGRRWLWTNYTLPSQVDSDRCTNSTPLHRYSSVR